MSNLLNMKEYIMRAEENGGKMLSKVPETMYTREVEAAFSDLY